MIRANFQQPKVFLNNFGRNIQGWINEPVSIFYSGQNPSHCYSDTLIVTVIGDSQRYNGIQYGYLKKCHWATKTQNCSKYNTIYINWVNIVYLRKLTFLKNIVIEYYIYNISLLQATSNDLARLINCWTCLPDVEK